MCQNGLFTICLSLVHDVLDMSKSTSTYCWSHLFTNSGNLVAHLIHFILAYIIPFFFFHPRNYIFFVRQRISFSDQRKYFNSKRTAFETTILELLKDFLSRQFLIENPLIVKEIVWQSIVSFKSIIWYQINELSVKFLPLPTLSENH